jgi:hypothetical protein
MYRYDEQKKKNFTFSFSALFFLFYEMLMFYVIFSKLLSYMSFNTLKVLVKIKS